MHPSGTAFPPVIPLRRRTDTRRRRRGPAGTLAAAWLGGCLLGALAAAAETSNAGPTDAAFSRFPGLQWARSGPERTEWLMREARCVRCHEAPAAWKERLDPGPAPDLSQRLGFRPPGFIPALLLNPAQTLPGARMPDVLAGLPPDRRPAAARALAAFLRAQFPAPSRDGLPAVHPLRFAQGRALFHQIGCVACHAPFDAAPLAPPSEDNLPAGPIDPDPDTRRRTVPLDGLGKRWTRSSLSSFLTGFAGDPGSLMPGFELNRAEALALAEYLLKREPAEGVPLFTDEERTVAGLPPDPAAVEEGRRLWGELRCGACHELSGAPAPGEGQRPPPRLDAIAFVGTSPQWPGCLGTTPTIDPAAGGLSQNRSPAPSYAFSPADAAAIRALIVGWQARPPDSLGATELACRELARFNCLACHRREGQGGLTLDQSRWFITLADWDAGWEGRLPPHLDGVGAKLQRSWLERVLREGTRVRPYLAARMPRLAPPTAARLAGALARADTPAGWEEEHPPAPSEAPPAIGRRLLGNEGLSCVTCHALEGRRGLTMNMLDLAWAGRRLQWPWFRRYLEDPVKWRPGTRMPSFWPEGRPVLPEALDGDPTRQIGAIWHALLEARSAEPVEPPPSGEE